MTFNRNAWYRQRGEPRLAVELTGNVRVFKAVRGPLLLYGHVEPIAGRGYVDQLGRRFDIKSGEIDLNGDILATQLRVNTEYKTPPSQDSGQSPVTVTLDVTGRPDQLKLDFSSEPAMTQSEILATIVNGTVAARTWRRWRRWRRTAGAAVQVGLSCLTGAVEEAAQRNIGLDVVQIRQDGLRGATLVAGKYLYPRLYFGIRQPVSFESRSADATENSPRSQFEAEYSAYPWLLLNAQGEGSRVQFMLRGRYAF
jgi:autotransporter translocation and assembly factor TamB